jgi:hypothetical protein
MAVRLLVCLRLVNLTATKLKAFQERSRGTFMPFEGDLRGHPDYLNQVFTDMNRCIERKGWKQVRSHQEQEQEQMRDAVTSELAQTGQPAPRSDSKAADSSLTSTLGKKKGVCRQSDQDLCASM